MEPRYRLEKDDGDVLEIDILELLGVVISKFWIVIGSAVLLAAAMGLIVYAVEFIGLNKYLTLLLQIPLGVLIYVGGSKLFHLDSFDYVLEMTKTFLKKLRKKKAKVNE